MNVAFCPKTNVLANFFTKKPRGSIFRRMEITILNFRKTQIMAWRRRREMSGCARLAKTKQKSIKGLIQHTNGTLKQCPKTFGTEMT